MMASAIRRILYEELLGLVRRLLGRFQKLLNQDLDRLIEGQEQLADDLERGESIKSLKGLKSAAEGQRTVALDPPGPGANKSIANRILKIEDKKDFRARFWIGALLLVLLLAIVAVVICLRSPTSVITNLDLMRLCIGLWLLFFVLAIALILPQPPPPWPAIVLRYLLAISVGIILSSVPGTLVLDIPTWGKASGGLGGFLISLLHTPRSLPV